MIYIVPKKTGVIIPHETFVFSGGEVNVRLPKIYYGDIVIHARINNSNDIMELLLVTDALRRQFTGDIELVLPYVPYARQDRVMVEGESLSIKVFCDLINAQGYKKVYILDPHSNVTPALLDRCIVKDNTYLFADAMIFFEDKKGLDINNFLLVSPDAGAKKKVEYLAKVYGYKKEIIVGGKTRNLQTGEITGSTIEQGASLVDGQDIVIVDDICDGGKTFIELAKVLKNLGAKNVYLVVTHGIFSKGMDVLLSAGISGVYTSNSFRNIDEDENVGASNVIIVGD